MTKGTVVHAGTIGRILHVFIASFLFHRPLTILTQMVADEFNFRWSKIENYIAEAEADLIPVHGQ